MITIFADDSKDRKGLGDIAIAISEILHIEDMDISIDVCHIDSGWPLLCRRTGGLSVATAASTTTEP